MTSLVEGNGYSCGRDITTNLDTANASITRELSAAFGTMEEEVVQDGSSTETDISAGPSAMPLGSELMVPMASACAPISGAVADPHTISSVAAEVQSNLPRHEDEIHLRSQVESLVRCFVSEELDCMGEMMDQFKGREHELIETLQTMHERAARAKKATLMKHGAASIPDTTMNKATQSSLTVSPGTGHDNENSVCNHNDDNTDEEYYSESTFNAVRVCTTSSAKASSGPAPAIPLVVTISVAATRRKSETSKRTRAPPSSRRNDSDLIYLYDPITRRRMIDPVVNAAGDSYERATLLLQLDDSIAASPADFSRLYYPNRALESILKHQREYESAKKRMRQQQRKSHHQANGTATTEEGYPHWAPLPLASSRDTRGERCPTMNTKNPSEKCWFYARPDGAATTATPPPPLPEAFYCPITCDIMVDPWIGPDGNTYEYDGICKWLVDHSCSPVTRESMALSQLRPNHAVYELIQWEVNHGRWPYRELASSSSSSSSSTSSIPNMQWRRHASIQAWMDDSTASACTERRRRTHCEPSIVHSSLYLPRPWGIPPTLVLTPVETRQVSPTTAAPPPLPLTTTTTAAWNDSTGLSHNRHTCWGACRDDEGRCGMPWCLILTVYLITSWLLYAVGVGFPEWKVPLLLNAVFSMWLLVGSYCGSDGSGSSGRWSGGDYYSD